MGRAISMRLPENVSAPVRTNFTPSDLNRLLGNEKRAKSLGQLVRRVIAEVQSAAKSEGWPLNRIEVNLYQDPEVTGWEYLVVLMVFDSSFELANQCLLKLCYRLDEFSGQLKAGEADLFRRLIYFDVAATQTA